MSMPDKKQKKESQEMPVNTDKPKNQTERRYFSEKVEIREIDGVKKIVGYAARFNELSKPLYGIFQEKILPGAFTRALKDSDIRGLFNHDKNFVLGRESAGTLKVYEDEAGLRYEITPADAQDVKDLMAKMSRGDIRESSFSFRVASDGAEWDDSGEMEIRTIKEIEVVYDVGPVTFPAYPTATAGVRSYEEMIKAEKPNKRSYKISNELKRLKLAEML
jgi:HK97 family phage prohead protease